MEKNIDIAALGELLIDFTEAGKSKDGRKLFEQNPGGAPANLLTVASHMGYNTAFIGKVGEDMHGDYLIRTLEKEGINTQNVIKDANYFTTLAFVEIDEKGERQFSFARKPGADTKISKEELDKEQLSKCKIFHFGSLSMVEEPSREATLEAINIAKRSGGIISYDPNYRASLWENPKSAIEMMKSVIKNVDLMKVSEEESELLTEISDCQQAADKLLSMGPKLVAITLGEKGVFIATSERKEIVDGFLVEAVDTTGAGDSFWGGFLSSLLSANQSVEEMNWDDIKRCAVIGNAVAGLCVQKRGGIPSIPSKEEVDAFIKEKRKME